MVPEREILIAGGGIGGLTAALCLAGAGLRVSVFERAREFGEIGAGIQLSPNCTRVLHHLGLAAALGEHAFLPQATEFRSWKTARLINSIPLGETVRKRYGFPYYHMHRGDLLRVLVAAVRRCPNIVLHLAAPVEGISQVVDGCPSRFSFPTDTAAPVATRSPEPVSGARDAGRVCLRVAGRSRFGDALVGADGIHSRVRLALFDAERAAFTGNVAWRALVPAERVPRDLQKPVGTVWWGPGGHVVCYFVRGGALLNCVCVVEKTGWEVESWTERGDQDELKNDFAGWHPSIQVLIDNADRDSLYKWALHDRPPLPCWSSGAVTLLGDACHPTLPFQAQGAAMAIEDAAVLANCLSTNADIGTALQRYEALRRDRTAAVQIGSRRNARVFHLRGTKAWLRNRVARRVGHRVMHNLFAYDAVSMV